jgi:hypothetical protein
VFIYKKNEIVKASAVKTVCRVFFAKERIHRDIQEESARLGSQTSASSSRGVSGVTSAGRMCTFRVSVRVTVRVITKILFCKKMPLVKLS